MPRRFLSIMRHSGTHLVKPILKNTIGTSKGGKGPTLLAFEPTGKVVVCTRDPRNRIISSFRYKQYRGGLSPVTGDVDALLAEYMVEKRIIEFMHEWADRWMRWPDAHYIRFEDFLKEDSVVRAVLGVAQYDGTETTEDAIREVWRKFYKNSPTYTGRHSRWQDWFGIKSREVWKERSGKLLVKKMGY